ncbi:MAG TPA: HNH endonuclease signature motif containing protein [Acidimicrobiia bacterium]|nr:HNH endonuclease signature motif containing protein [Acidimicrobiia bacterium]
MTVTNRLQIHHLIPWSQGGRTDPDNLITLCWYHHQIIIHQQGFTPQPHPDHRRIRFRRGGYSRRLSRPPPIPMDPTHPERGELTQSWSDLNGPIHPDRHHVHPHFS